MTPPTSTASRKRTRSTNISEHHGDIEATSSTSSTISTQSSNTVPPKRQRNNTPSSNAPSISSRANYSLRNRSITSDTQQSSIGSSSIDLSTNSQRYNLRPRQPQSQIQLPQTLNLNSNRVPRRARRQISSTITQSVQSTSSIVQPRQYRLVYISDDDDPPTSTTQTSTSMTNTTLNLITDDEDDEVTRVPQPPPRRTARTTTNTGHNTR